MLDKTVSGKTPETFLYDLRQESNLRAYDGRCTTFLPTTGFLPDDVKFR